MEKKEAASLFYSSMMSHTIEMIHLHLCICWKTIFITFWTYENGESLKHILLHARWLCLIDRLQWKDQPHIPVAEETSVVCIQLQLRVIFSVVFWIDSHHKSHPSNSWTLLFHKKAVKLNKAVVMPSALTATNHCRCSAQRWREKWLKKQALSGSLPSKTPLRRARPESQNYNLRRWCVIRAAPSAALADVLKQRLRASVGAPSFWSG